MKSRHDDFSHVACNVTPQYTKGDRLRRGTFGIAVLATAISLLAATGCNNKRFDPKKGGSNLGVLLNGNESTSSLVVSQILFTNASPDTSIDVIGDGTGQIYSTCGDAASSGVTRCGCVFTYDTNSNTTESFERPTTYVENNLMRCDYTGIPVYVTTVKIHIIDHGTDQATSDIDFKLSGGSVALDPTDPRTFVRVRRYQCRDVYEVPNMLDNGVYDPLQSEDILATYPRNYYGTNFFTSMNYYTGTDKKNYECEFNGDNSANTWVSYGIYSSAPDPDAADPTNSAVIFSTSSSDVSRYQFYVARQPAGRFSAPINAMTAPELPTTVGNTQLPPPIGYGVTPTASGTGRETCPADADAPSGFVWKKLWLFEANLTPRSYIRSSTGISAIQSAICNPGIYKDTASAATPVTIYPQCGDKGVGGLYNLTSSGPLYSRLLGNLVCVNVFPSDQRSGNGVPLQADRWVPTRVDLNDAANGTCDSAAGSAMNVCPKLDKNTSAPKLVAGTSGSAPYDDQISTTQVDTDGTRKDYVFVVTPPTVNSSDMAGSGFQQYKPLTYFLSSDCDAARAKIGSCVTSHQITYTLKDTSVEVNSNVKNKAFPVCVLQPKP